MKLNNEVKQLFINSLHSFSSNLISLLTSLFITLILPKVIGVSDFGYFQLYIFYSSYVGLLHFGWNDGLYLKLGGKNYNEIDKNLYFSQFYSLLLLQIVILLLFIVFLNYGNSHFIIEKKYILCMTFFNMLIVNLRYMLIYILQATNKIKEYSWILFLENIIIILFFFAAIFFQIRAYKYFIFYDLLSKFISLIFAIFLCKDIVLRSLNSFRLNIKEISENIKIGMNLMFSNIASKLIVGNVRFSLEYFSSILIFSNLSLSLSISNFIIIFLNSISLVLFPYLRNIEQERLKSIFIFIDKFTSFFFTSFLLIYFPLIKFLEFWLPQFNYSIKYLAILFPLIIYEGKMSLIYNTYFKTLRFEKSLLLINLFVFLISFIVTFINLFFLKIIDFYIFSILFFVMIRCSISEIILKKTFNLNYNSDIIIQLFISLLFVLFNVNFSFYISMIFFLISYVLYLVFYHKKIIEILILIKYKLFSA